MRQANIRESRTRRRLTHTRRDQGHPIHSLDDLESRGAKLLAASELHQQALEDETLRRHLTYVDEMPRVDQLVLMAKDLYGDWAKLSEALPPGSILLNAVERVRRYESCHKVNLAEIHEKSERMGYGKNSKKTVHTY